MSPATSRKGVARGVPSREFRILIKPPCSTMNRRPTSPVGAVRKTGEESTAVTVCNRKLSEVAGGGLAPPPPTSSPLQAAMRAQSKTPKKQIEPARDHMVPDYYEIPAGS